MMKSLVNPFDETFDQLTSVWRVVYVEAVCWLTKWIINQFYSGIIEILHFKIKFLTRDYLFTGSVFCPYRILCKFLAL